tara:strand:+ start:932 stop:1492 length:561 start_codon:yes stop_codon:yes gene_type:complete
MKDSVQLFLFIALMFLGSVWTMTSLIHYEKQIESLEIELETQTDSLNCTIDSLKLEIDTLTWETELWDYEIKNQTSDLLSAIMFVESSYNDSAYCEPEDAVGVLQIRKTMVDDVNRILERQGSYKRYTYQCRWNRLESIDMFNIYVDYYRLESAEEIARCWNGGPRGMDKEATVYYWNKVQDHLDS